MIEKYLLSNRIKNTFPSQRAMKGCLPKQVINRIKNILSL